MFHLSIFRKTLFVSNHDNDNKIDSASSHEDDFKELRTCGNVLPTPILGQLQRLFSRLLYSKRSSVDTIDLLESFGWSKAERVEQHDVHEFFSVLLDAIGSESPEYGNKLSLIFAGFNNGMHYRNYSMKNIVLFSSIVYENGSLCMDNTNLI